MFQLLNFYSTSVAACPDQSGSHSSTAVVACTPNNEGRFCASAVFAKLSVLA